MPILFKYILKEVFYVKKNEGKTDPRVRRILELLHKDLSAREISKILNVSRNSVAFVKESYDKCDKDWDEICLMNDDEIYPLFCPHTFRPRSRFAPVDYSYVHSELKKVGVTEMLLWEEYCEKCNTEGVSHRCYATFANGYKRFIADKDYTSHIERKPGVILEVDWPGPTMGYMASVEGAVGKIARKIIGMLRNEAFYSIEGLNSAIRKALDKLNDKPFQKRNGSRKTIYELEEKPYLRPLPMLPFEICEWSYNHKVGPNSHIWFHKG